MLMLAVTLPEPILLNKSGPRCSIKHCLVTACTALLSALSLPWFGLCQLMLSKITSWHSLGNSTGQQPFPVGNIGHDCTRLGCVQSPSTVFQQALHPGRATRILCHTMNTAVTQWSHYVVHFELKKQTQNLSCVLDCRDTVGDPEDYRGYTVWTQPMTFYQTAKEWSLALFYLQQKPQLFSKANLSLHILALRKVGGRQLISCRGTEKAEACIF